MKKLLIIGTNDIATACATRLYRAGFSICIISRDISFDLNSFRNFSVTLKNGSKTIENIKAISFADFIFHNTESANLSINHFVDFVLQDRQIPVLSKDDSKSINLSKFEFCINCDDDLFNNLEVSINLPVISCTKTEIIQADYKVISQGEHLGRVKYPFLDFPEVENEIEDTLFIKSLEEGIFIAEKAAGEKVIKDEKIATVGNIEVYSGFTGYITGVISSGLIVSKDLKIFSLSHNKPKGDILQLPAETFAIAGGVLEAVLFHNNLNEK
ncbi:MAG: hypothetical protein D8M58_18445 [Calditrichaeota bacterium]|nr:MAG: hypothetical protein DWQ03_11675 [Calditrichota bacterium]MBL1207391.1 hypothetical protein [Calditrichota bacterium]NOG47223.1 hypothetical protein [Calditrichota bacterium]